MIDISVVIPYIHEYPALIHTVFAIQNEFLDLPYSYEIIVVENGERDQYTDRFLQYLRRLISIRRLSYFFEPRQCGPIARNTGAKNARGKYLIFTDAHCQWGKNTVPLLINTIEEKENAGIVHGSTVWSHYDAHHAGCHYQLFGSEKRPTLFSHMHGSYIRCRNASEPYLVGGGSLAYVLFRRKEFLELRGYNENCRYYPHPEGYLPLKYWIMGKECWLNPKAFHYHSMYPRNYGSPPTLQVTVDGKPYVLSHNDNLIRNAMICAYALGGNEWIDRVYNEWVRRGGRKNVLDGIKESALEGGAEDRDWIQDKAVYTLDEVLVSLYQKKVKGMEVLPPYLQKVSP